MDLLRTLVTPDDVVLGVGFRVAEVAVELSRLARQVYAFEPNPYALARVKKAVRKMKNVQLFNMGAGAVDETAMLKLPELVDKPQGARSQPVQLARLDRVQFALPPTCLMLNCGGAELGALEGARGLFSAGKVKTVLLKSHELADGRKTGPEATLWLLEHGFKTEPKKAEDGSLWIIGRSPPPTEGPLNGQPSR